MAMETQKSCIQYCYQDFEVKREENKIFRRYSNDIGNIYDLVTAEKCFAKVCNKNAQ